ncbi:MAG TPA: hypothetical protein VME41_10940 [Stellaceae bacterium]|nr:hypothetical protein [Stellaceae bacterium]
MPDDSNQHDSAIIQAAYAERVREAFRVFAENLAMGENERGSRDRFVRTVEQTRKARDMALQAIVSGAASEAEQAVAAAAPAGDELSDEQRALVEQALAGTTGQRAPAPLSPSQRSPLIRR